MRYSIRLAGRNWLRSYRALGKGGRFIGYGMSAAIEGGRQNVVLVTANFTWLGLVRLVPRKSAHWYNITTEEKKRGLSLKSIGLRLHRRPAAAKIGVELFRVSDPSSTPAVSAEPSFRQSNPAHGVFMRLSPEIHVPDPHSPEPAILGVLKPPEKPLTRSRAPAPRLKGNSARSTLEYENPDLTRPSVSSF